MRWAGQRFVGGGLFKSVFCLPVILFVAFIACVVYLTPYVATALEGAVDRFDFMIGYEVEP